MSNKKLVELKAVFCAMWHFVLAQTLQCLLWFSIESRSSDYPGLSPSALHPETQGSRMISWGALGKAAFWQAWKLGEDGQDTGSQEFTTQHFHLSNLYFQDTGCWHLVTVVYILYCMPGDCEKAQNSIVVSSHMPGHPCIPRVHAKYLSHFIVIIIAPCNITWWISDF